MAEFDEDRVTITHSGHVRRTTEARPVVAEYFQVLGNVGSGGMGDVHAARDLDLGRVVALKVIGGHVASSRTLTARFLTEAQVTAQLDHPHIVPVYRLEQTEAGTPAFSMKLIKGRTLKAILAEGKMPLVERLEAFVAVCDAMAYAHERGVIHRDLKPDNIMIGAHGEVYVVDWGVAKVFGVADVGLEELVDAGSDSVHKTQAGVVLGTPLYLSPELARDMDLDGRSDQYTLGLILQEIVTGKRAVDAKTPFHALSLADEGIRVKMTGPKDLIAIVDRACAVDRDKRYANVHDLAQDVRCYIRGDEVSARPDGLFRGLWRWTRRNPVPTLSALGLVFGLGAAVTIVSLTAVAAVQTQSAVNERVLGERVGAVARRSQAIDSQMLHYQALLDGVAQQAMKQWSVAVPTESTAFERDAFRNGEVAGYTESPVYGMAVSFEHPLTLRAPGVELASVAEEVGRVADLRHDFRRVLLRSHGEEATTLASDAQEALMRTEGTPVAFVYVGLENGVVLNYPGHAKLSDEYDPRKRPWYQAAKGTRGPTWGEPYQAASGFSLLMACTEALYDRDGQFFGVAGLDVALDTVIEMMAIDVEGASRTWLVNDQGNVVVSSDQAGMNLGEGLHGNQSLGTEPFPHPDVRAAIASGAEYGTFEIDGGLVVFDRMDAMGFVYAVEILD